MKYSLPNIKTPTIDGLNGNIYFKEVDVRTIKQTPIDKRMKITDASGCYSILKKYVYESNELINTFENFYVIYLNRQNNIIGFQHLSKGGIDATVVDVKIILATALKLLSSSIILSHNHPSGNLRPSDADNQITKKIKEAAKLMDISVLDHLIVTEESFFSFADEGLMGLSGIHNISLIEELNQNPTMITPNNYYQEINHIGAEHLPQPMQEMHELINDLTQNGKDWNDFNSDAEIKNSVTVQFTKLQEWINKNNVDETFPKKAAPKKHVDKRTSHRPMHRTAAKKEVPTSTIPKKEPKVATRKEPKAKPAKAVKLESWVKFKELHPEASKQAYFLYVELQQAQGTAIPLVIKKAMEDFNTQSDEPITADLRFVKRFLKMKDKQMNKADVLRFVKSLQKAIRERQINKKSEYNEQIKHIQHLMVDLYNNNKLANVFTLHIDESTTKKYEKILGGSSIIPSVRLLKRFVLLQGKDDGEKISRLYAEIIKEMDNLETGSFYYKTLRKAKELLNEARGGALQLTEQELNGLLGFDCFCSKKNSLSGVEKIDKIDQSILNNSNTFSAKEVLNKQFKVLAFDGKYQKLLGNPELGFSMMIYGKPKSGKSTFAIDFAQYLAQNHGKVLYVSVEEGISHTLADKIKRLQATSLNLFFDGSIPNNLSSYDFVFIDSINRAMLSITELIELKQQYHNKTFVFVFQVTKDGKFRGSQEFEHEVDVVVKIDSGIASANGRFAQGEEIAVRF